MDKKGSAIRCVGCEFYSSLNEKGIIHKCCVSLNGCVKLT